jgi:hypothetical protein
MKLYWSNVHLCTYFTYVRMYFTFLPSVFDIHTFLKTRFWQMIPHCVITTPNTEKKCYSLNLGDHLILVSSVVSSV